MGGRRNRETDKKYGAVLGFASNKDNRLSMIHFPEVRKGDETLEGTMGHDSFGNEGRKLVRMFPICNVYWHSDVAEGRFMGAATVARLSLDRRWDVMVEVGSNFDDARMPVLSGTVGF